MGGFSEFIKVLFQFFSEFVNILCVRLSVCTSMQSVLEKFVCASG